MLQNFHKSSPLFGMAMSILENHFLVLDEKKENIVAYKRVDPNTGKEYGQPFGESGRTHKDCIKKGIECRKVEVKTDKKRYTYGLLDIFFPPNNNIQKRGDPHFYFEKKGLYKRGENHWLNLYNIIMLLSDEQWKPFPKESSIAIVKIIAKLLRDNPAFMKLLDFYKKFPSANNNSTLILSNEKQKSNRKNQLRGLPLANNSSRMILSNEKVARKNQLQGFPLANNNSTLILSKLVVYECHSSFIENRKTNEFFPWNTKNMNNNNMIFFIPQLSFIMMIVVFFRFLKKMK